MKYILVGIVAALLTHSALAATGLAIVLGLILEACISLQTRQN
ncbi:MAG: hypothetical protein ACJ8R9_10865 [Steroidobacteraceae bacterium]